MGFGVWGLGFGVWGLGSACTSAFVPSRRGQTVAMEGKAWAGIGEKCDGCTSLLLLLVLLSVTLLLLSCLSMQSSSSGGGCCLLQEETGGAAVKCYNFSLRDRPKRATPLILALLTSTSTQNTRNCHTLSLTCDQHGSASPRTTRDSGSKNEPAGRQMGREWSFRHTTDGNRDKPPPPPPKN